MRSASLAVLGLLALAGCSDGGGGDAKPPGPVVSAPTSSTGTMGVTDPAEPLEVWEQDFELEVTGYKAGDGQEYMGTNCVVLRGPLGPLSGEVSLGWDLSLTTPTMEVAMAVEGNVTAVQAGFTNVTLAFEGVNVTGTLAWAWQIAQDEDAGALVQETARMAIRLEGPRVAGLEAELQACALPH